jgi:hypothetical protein
VGTDAIRTQFRSEAGRDSEVKPDTIPGINRTAILELSGRDSWN